MRFRPAATTLALASIASLAVAGPAVSANKTSTKLSIQTEEDGFSGFVKSSRESCHNGRKVTLYRKVSGPDKKAGSDTAQPNGDGSQWKISVSRDGSYYAVVKATSKCGGKTSAVKKITLGEGASAADDPPAVDEPTAVRLKIRQGTGDRRKGVTGTLVSQNPDCVEGQKVLFYRQVLGTGGEVIRERKVGYNIAHAIDSAPKKSKVFTFGLSSSGRIVARTNSSDSCKAGRSNVVRYRSPTA